MLKSVIFSSVAAMALVAMSPAGAAVVYSNTFDGEGGAGSTLNFNGFTGLTVSAGTVDLINNGDFSIACSGKCVDLDGSTGNGGELQTTASYAFNAGDLVTFSFDLGGSQRGDGANPFDAGFRFASATGLLSFTTGGAYGNSTALNVAPLTQTVYSGTSFSGDAFQSFSLSFRAATAGSVQSYINTSSNDNIGPLVDNFSLSVAAVPEPATWAMMIGGVGMIGGGLRRRRASTKLALA